MNFSRSIERLNFPLPAAGSPRAGHKQHLKDALFSSHLLRWRTGSVQTIQSCQLLLNYILSNALHKNISILTFWVSPTWVHTNHVCSQTRRTGKNRTFSLCASRLLSEWKAVEMWADTELWCCKPGQLYCKAALESPGSTERKKWRGISKARCLRCLEKYRHHI